MSVLWIDPYKRAATAAGHRYWKFTFSNGGDAEAEMAEIELLISSVDQTSGASISATNTNAGAAANLIDDSTGTKWGGFPLDATVTVDLGSALAIDAYTITAISGAGHYPRQWVLAWSDDDVSYTTADSQTGQSFTSLEKKTYSL